MELIIISLPIISALALLTLGRYIGEKGSKYIGIGSMSIITIISSYILILYLKGNEIIKITRSPYILEKINKIITGTEGGERGWIEINGIEIRVDWEWERYSIWMIWLVSIFTTIIINYGYWYLEEEEGKIRFIGLFLLFASAMNILILGSNILILFIGWELVGLLSFWLIQYWNYAINNIKASFKALFFNKIGDLALILGYLYLISKGQTLEYETFTNVDSLSSLNLGELSFFIASIIKSAQFFFHPWLSDAMAGPTPVSALLHAATMVTAGIYLFLKLGIMGNNIINNNILLLLLLIGSITLIFTGLSSSYSFDMKRLIAFSTASHLALMFISLFFIKGLGSYAFLHLMIHAFFKSLLFLSSGLLIHLFSSFFTLSPSQDIRKFASIGLISPYYSLLVLIGILSLIGFPSFSGFYSKDKLINSALYIYYLLNMNNLLFLFILLFGGLLSIYYSFKFFSIFYSQPSSSLFNPSLSYFDSSTSTSPSPHPHPRQGRGWGAMEGDIQGRPKITERKNYLRGTSGLGFFLLLSIFFGSALFNSFISPLSSFLSLEILVPTFSIISSIDYIFRSLGVYLIIIFIIILIIYYILNNIIYRWYNYTNRPSLYSSVYDVSSKGKALIIFNYRFFIDSILSYLLYLPFFSSSYFFFFKSLDRGLLEFFGPIGLSRLFSSCITTSLSYPSIASSSTSPEARLRGDGSIVEGDYNYSLILRWLLYSFFLLLLLILFLI